MFSTGQPYLSSKIGPFLALDLSIIWQVISIVGFSFLFKRNIGRFISLVQIFIKWGKTLLTFTQNYFLEIRVRFLLLFWWTREFRQWRRFRFFRESQITVLGLCWDHSNKLRLSSLIYRQTLDIVSWVFYI